MQEESYRIIRYNTVYLMYHTDRMTGTSIVRNRDRKETICVFPPKGV